MKSMLIKISVLMLIVITIFGLQCTINQDNGSLVKPGPNTPPTDSIPDTTGHGRTIVPVIFASLDSAYVKPHDTLAIHISIYNDSTLGDTVEPLSNRRISATANRGWLSNDTLTSNANGSAVLYFTDTTGGNIDITLSSGTASRIVRFKVSDVPSYVQRLIQILPEKSSIKADGKDQVTINVSLIDTNHNPVVGQTIQFISTAGTISGNPQISSEKSGQSKTDLLGIAKATLISTPINDTAYITAYLSTDRSLSAQAVVAIQGVNIQLVADSTNLSTNGQSGLTATVFNGSNEPIANSPIYFLTGKGSSIISIVYKDTITGIGQNFLGKARALISAGATSGSDSVLVLAAGAQASIKFNVTDLVLKLVAYPSDNLQAKKDTADLFVTFTEKNGTPLVSKPLTLIRFYQDFNQSPTSDTLNGTTDVQGKYTFKILPLDFDGTIRLQVTAYKSSIEIASAQTSLTYRTTRSLSINAIPPLIPADRTSTSQIIVLVKTLNGNNPVVGDKVMFSTDAGTIPASAVTDAGGRATVNLVSDRRNAIAKIRVWLEKEPKRIDSTTVEFTGIELSASASPLSIRSNGTDTSTIVVTLKDANKTQMAGETVDFLPQQANTHVIPIDSFTNNRGEFRAKVTGTGTGQDTILVRSAGAITRTVINYSSNFLTIDTVRGLNQHYLAVHTDSTTFEVTYRNGSGATIPNAFVEFSITTGAIGTIFADTLSTDAQGKVRFKMSNPDFATTVVVAALAHTSSEITTADFRVYFQAAPIFKIELHGTPEVISTNGARAQITATAFDINGNRVKDAHIAFNMISGPGGGEYLDPPTAITRLDGTASTSIVSGTIPSNYKDVWIVAGDFTAIKSDTCKFTIAGPPAHITIRANLAEITKNTDGTYSKTYCALLSDVNGNPVADGTEVTFSAIVTGYYIYYVDATFLPTVDNGQTSWNVRFDTTDAYLPFEDLNNNFKLDPGEDINGDGFANRGEDRNGDGIWNVGPAFEDWNHNGIRDTNPEPWVDVPSGQDSTGKTLYTTWYAQMNDNGLFDLREPLLDTAYQAAYNRLLHENATIADSTLMRSMDAAYFAQKSAAGKLGFDMDWNKNGVIDPNTAITTKRTVITANGIATNSVTYGQTDGRRIEIMLNCESQGLVAPSPEIFMAPIAQGDGQFWQAISSK